MDSLHIILNQPNSVYPVGAGAGTVAPKDERIGSQNYPSDNSSQQQEDVVQISARGRELGQQAAEQSSQQSDGQTTQGSQELSAEEQDLVRQLEARDQEVRRHEQTHQAVLGQYAQGGPSYEYTRGPDDKNYATGGHVSVDMSTESEPEQTITKAQTIRRGALAPADPSGADQAIAAAATQMEMQARQELAAQQRAQAQETSEKVASNNPYAKAAGASATTGQSSVINLVA